MNYASSEEVELQEKKPILNKFDISQNLATV
jgi:hypothetical protein